MLQWQILSNCPSEAEPDLTLLCVSVGKGVFEGGGDVIMAVLEFTPAPWDNSQALAPPCSPQKCSLALSITQVRAIGTPAFV